MPEDAGAADQTERSRKWRAGFATRLDVIEQRTAALPEIQAQLAALTELLGIELTRTTPPEHRPR